MATMEALYRALVPIPEMDIRAGDYLLVTPRQEISISQIRHLEDGALPAVCRWIADRRLTLVNGPTIAQDPDGSGPTLSVVQGGDRPARRKRHGPLRVIP